MLLCGWGVFVKAQGINQRYSFGRPNTVGASILYDGHDFIVSGLVTDSLAQYAQALWAKIDTAGNITSFKPSGIPNMDVNTYSPNMFLDYSSRYVNTGFLGNGENFVIKSDSSGYVSDFKLYTDTVAANFSISSIMQASDSNYYVTGGLEYTSSNPGDVLFAKINSNGVLCNKKVFGTNHKEYGTCLMELPNHNILVGAYNSNLNLIPHQYPYQIERTNTWLLEVDTGGNLVRQWKGSNDSTYWPTKMLLLDDSNFVYTTPYIGYWDSTSPDGYYGCYFAKRDLNFNKIWEVKWNCDPGVWAATPTFDSTSQGDFIMVAETYAIPLKGNYLVTKISSSGATLWQKQYYPIDTFIYETYPNSVKVLPNGNIAIWGEFRPVSFGIGRQQAWLLVLDSNGCLTSGCTTGWIEEDVVSERIKTYPNPAHSSFSIDIENPLLQGGSLDLYNIDGKKLCSTANNFSRQTRVDISQLPNGIYLWRYNAPNQTVQSGKVVKE